MDPPRDDEGLPEGNVLDPEDLDISDAEEVEELDESRFVIGAEGTPNVEDSPSPGTAAREATAGDPEGLPGIDEREAETANQPPELGGSDVKRWITQNLRQTDSQYAYRLAAKTGEEISHQQLASDDIGMAFDGLLMWYAQQVGDGTAVEDTLGILLSESNIRVRFPVAALQAYLEENGLDPQDSIADLLAVVQERDGLVFPRGTRR
jgi:hypothetical protein